MESFTSLVEIINAGGTLAVLVFIIFAFYRGEIWPTKHVDKVVTEVRESSKAMADEVKEGITDAVHTAIVTSMSEIRKTNGRKDANYARLQREVEKIQAEIDELKTKENNDA